MRVKGIRRQPNTKGVVYTARATSFYSGLDRRGTYQSSSVDATKRKKRDASK